MFIIVQRTTIGIKKNIAITIHCNKLLSFQSFSTCSGIFWGCLQEKSVVLEKQFCMALSALTWKQKY